MNKKTDEAVAGALFILGSAAVTLGAGLLWGGGAAALVIGAILILLAIGVVMA